jgi:predicted RNA-binding Zn-ribbon protein involved in translation (DUF1610 family)
MSEKPKVDSKHQHALQALSLQTKLQSLSSGVYTKKDMIWEGVALIVVGVFCAVGAYLIHTTGYIAVIQILLIPGAVICGFWGISKLSDGLGSSQESFKCPNCTTETALLEHLTIRPCPACLHVIYKLGNMQDARSFVGTCSHCQSEFYLYAGIGDFRCPNCGSYLAINPESESLELSSAAVSQCACGAQLPDGAFACHNCHKLIVDQEILEVDDLTRCSLSMWGHLIRAQVSCDCLRTDIMSLKETNPSLDTLLVLITRIEVILAYLEVAAQDHALCKQTGVTLSAMQEMYAYVVAGLHSVLASKKSWKFENPILLPVTSQHRVLSALGTCPEGVCRWNDNLISYTIEKTHGYSSTGKEAQRYIVSAYDNLLQEAFRLSGDGMEELPDAEED